MSGKTFLSGECFYFQVQVGLIPRGGIFLDDAQLRGAVDDGEGLREQVCGTGGVFRC